MKKSSLVLLPVLFLAACASVDTVRMKEAPSRGDSCHLDVYNNLSEVKRSYESVCSVASSTGTHLFADRTVQGAINQAKPEACKCGGDAIVIGTVGSTGFSMTGYGQGTASVTVIKYTDSKK